MVIQHGSGMLARLRGASFKTMVLLQCLFFSGREGLWDESFLWEWLQLGGWNQKCVWDGSRGWSLTSSLEAWSICLTPHYLSGDMVPKLTVFRIVIQNLKSVVFFLKVNLYFIFGIYFYMCICVCVHIHTFPHTPHSMICLVSLFVFWLITEFLSSSLLIIFYNFARN